MTEYSGQMSSSGENMTLESLPQNCSGCIHSPSPDLNVPKAVALGLVLGVFLVFGVLGNILVILSVLCHRHLRTATHYFIANLAVADLLLSAAVLPFSVTFEILGRWVFGRLLCNIWAAVDVLCCTASILSLCAISVDRYIGVSYPLRYPAMMTERRGLLALALLWALSAAISAGPLLGWREPAPEDESVCAVNQEPGYAIFSAVGSFYLPLTIILAMYCRVYVVARRETLGLREGHKAAGSDLEGVTLRMHRGNTAVSDDEALHSRTHFTLRLLKFSREKKAAKTLGIVVGCFVLCWLPFFLVLPIGSIFPAHRPSDTVFKVTFWLGYFNSCINPIIYPCSSKEFKRAFQNVLGLRCHSHRSAPHLGPALGRSSALNTPPRPSPSCVPTTSPRPSQASPQEAFAGTQAARVHSKRLLRACCCVRGASRPLRLQSNPCSCGTAGTPQPPLAKVHQLSLGWVGEPL
ncbi:alpha-1A adrenergic receptor-like [Scleropages formosus]|uniref:Alpha-1A adrenergic receptor n=1 Tax=Scleropages formosus TaxID=113540 RepID=A0A0P7XHG9_SCLFO|nr:alpha-1A adrenergic receptor-like [Scleropages formosus]KPP75802.1 alpha-1A adrenergic receptor-like [Scleropages formosus]